MSQTSDITLSPRAAAHIATLLQDEGAGAALRVSVQGGGCSGFQYGFTIDDAPLADDLVLGSPGAQVLIDRVSQAYLHGAEIDWADDLIGSSFQIKNPNAQSGCGCGNSFSL